MIYDRVGIILYVHLFKFTAKNFQVIFFVCDLKYIDPQAHYDFFLFFQILKVGFTFIF